MPNAAPRLRALGAIGVAGYAVHAGYHAAAGRPEDALWVCHLAALAVGAGLAFGRPILNAAGLLCLAVGTPIWILDLLGGSPFFPTSVLTHVLGPVLGLVGARAMGLPRRAWLAGWALAAGSIAASLAFTPAHANVNLAFRPPSLWTWAPAALPLYLAWLICLWGAALFASEIALRKIWVRNPPGTAPASAE